MIRAIATPNLDNKNPRAQLDGILSKGTNSLVSKAQAAHLNGLESFPPFAAGVLAVVATGADHAQAGNLCSLHLLCRAAFNVLYMGTSGEGAAALRSVMWLLSTTASCQLIA